MCTGASQTEFTDLFSAFHLLRAIILEYGAHKHGSSKALHTGNIPMGYISQSEGERKYKEEKS